MDLQSRRHFLRIAGGLVLAFGCPGLLRAATDLPIADAHSHFGLTGRRFPQRSLKEQMEEAGVLLLSWSMVGDRWWTASTNRGIVQNAAPRPGQQLRNLRDYLSEVRRYLASIGLDFVQGPADIDAARAGRPQVVLALEGAGFAEDGLDALANLHAMGLRHVQLVHYIRNEIGDIQTDSPRHEGMTVLGVDLVKACNKAGMLVDLAHATDSAIDKALEVSSAPPIWSHSAITATRYNWQRSPSLSRLLHVDQARKIAQRGGAVGLWSLRSPAVSNPAGFAGELLRMVDLLGAEHVMFGSDMDGVGDLGMLSGLGDLRRVGDELRRRGVDEKTMKAVCFENYARCLRVAMEGRQA